MNNIARISTSPPVEKGMREKSLDGMIPKCQPPRPSLVMRLIASPPFYSRRLASLPLRPVTVES